MTSLNYFDIVIMILFSVISFSIYKMLKADNIEGNTLTSNKNIKKDKVVSIFKNKKELQNFIFETLKNESLELKAEKLSKLDKSFNPQDFMTHTKEFFEIIIKYFNTKEIEKIKPKVSDKVLKEFKLAISEFDKNKQSLCSEIIRFKSIIIKDISITNRVANIIVEFTTEQTAVIKNTAGKIINGDENQLETIVDIWSFTKNLSIKNSSWILDKTIEG